MQRGFIQIPILIAIIVGVVVVGGAGHVGVKQYQNQRIENFQETLQQESATEGEEATSTDELSEVEKLRQEIDELKKQQSSPVSTQKQEAPAPVPAKRTTLSNAQIVSKVKPATVFIETTEGAGSGMILDSNGYILTNAHVLYDVSVAEVRLSDGRSFSAEVIGRDEVVDLAILKIAGNNLSFVTLGNSDTVAQGDNVFTLGYPFGFGNDVSFKEGTISRRISSEGTTYLETSAEIHPGNSGGPLVNEYGEVIGVNSATFGNSVKGLQIGETIKFAIPINIAKNNIPSLKNGKVSLLPVNPKKIEHDEFSTFRGKYVEILEKGLLGLDMIEESYTNYFEILSDITYGRGLSGSTYEKYLTDVNKIKETVDFFESVIQEIQNLQTPDVPFADTIEEMLQLKIRRYDYSIEILANWSVRYEVIGSTGNSQEEIMVFMDKMEILDAEMTKKMKEIDTFENTRLQPKIDKYLQEIKEYFQ